MREFTCTVGWSVALEDGNFAFCCLRGGVNRDHNMHFQLSLALKQEKSEKKENGPLTLQ